MKGDLPGRQHRGASTGPLWLPVSPVARHKLAVGELILRTDRPGPPLGANIGRREIGSQRRFDDAVECLQESLAAERSGGAYLGLGRFYLRDCKYGRAIGSLRKALAVNPGNAATSMFLSEALRGRRLEGCARSLLPARQHLINLAPVPIRGRVLWAALSAEPTSDGKSTRDGDSFPNHCENACITVFAQQGTRLRTTWRSPLVSSIEQRNFWTVDVWAFAMNRGHVPDIVFSGVCVGGSSEPTRMLIYRWNGRIFREVLDADSEEQPLWVQDLRHDGNFQVRAGHLAGTTMSHRDQFRWVDVYAWNGRRFAQADSRYPEQFRTTRADLQGLLRKRPDDVDLLRYLRRAYLIQGDRTLAARALRDMVRAGRQPVQTKGDDIESYWDLGDALRLSGRRAESARCFRHVQSLGRQQAARESDGDTRQYYRDRIKDAADQILALSRRPRR